MADTSNDGLGEAGFTVVEVLVALAIFSLSISVLFNVIAEGLWNTANAEMLSRAGLVAQAVLNRVGTDLPLREGEFTGKIEGLSWRIKISPYDTSEFGAARVQIYHVLAEVPLKDRNGQSVALDTLRLGPKEPQ